MSAPYVEPHWKAFSEIAFDPQGAVGEKPASWIKRNSLSGVPEGVEWPSCKLHRSEVRDVCRNPKIHVLVGYIHAMAWGGQGNGAGGRRHVESAWAESRRLEQHLKTLRDGGLTRRAAYDLFSNSGAVQGLGPSFFTKLTYFFCANVNCYIMDQWTAKSVNLLVGKQVVKMAGDAPSRLNSGRNYEEFCEQVDVMAKKLSVPGEVLEERLFSKGGRKPFGWRAYLRAQKIPNTQ